MSNKLAGETSPYLLQHADNPVEWYPWGPEALALAHELDKPILLSVGYAACHWCHVMAHESFEDEATAAIMNRYFVNIKVDREERPDIDSIYMGAVQALNNGQGGWPMTVFMTPDGEPFYGGTYYPPVPRYGMPSFSQLLESIAAAWQTRRDEINSSAQNIAAHLSRTLEPTGPSTAPNEALFDQALDSILRQFDSRDGGFGGAPKFPPSMTLEFLLRMVVARDDPMAMHMVEHTLKRMAHGGIYDQIGGGFARYATDIRWLVPHFEKMLYDNALLARVYLHAYQISGRPLFRRIVEETLDFVARDMRHKDGGFYSSYDADSEGVEGKFYVWQEEEIRQVLGGDADLFKARYGVSAAGNWEGQNILEIVADIPDLAQRFDLDQEEVTQRLDSARQRLLKARAERAWPGLDDKVLTAWNGLMMAAFAEAGRALQRADYTAIATDNALFLWNKMRDADGRLLRTWNPASDASLARYNAYLEDYAFLADGLLALYQTTFETRWFAWAEELAQHMLTHFHDANNGGFFDTSDDHESLLYRPKDLQDNAIPSGNAMAVQVLQKLSLFTGNGRYWDAAQDSLQRLTGLMARFPTGFAHWLCATAFALGSPLEIAIAGTLDEPGARTLLDALNTGYRPNLVLAVGEENQEIPLLQGRSRLDGSPAAYVCRQFVCKMPVTTPQELLRQLN